MSPVVQNSESSSTGSTRDQIVAVADRLFYEGGFDHTSFATIADEVGISRGNFYHHFKSKDAILEAVIQNRLESTEKLLTGWEREADSPEGRIRCFIRIVIVNGDPIRRSGCPVGTLNTEMAKLEHPARDRARELFVLFRHWLARQFEAIGAGQMSDDLAMHVIAFSQGQATLLNAFGDKEFVNREVARMEGWLDELVRSIESE